MKKLRSDDGGLALVLGGTQVLLDVDGVSWCLDQDSNWKGLGTYLVY